MKILGIESSCDETAASVVVDGRTVLSNEISTQIPIHTLYGGVVPEIASRKHVERITQVVDLALKKAETTADELDAVAVTYGPGLVGPLLVGVSFAKTFAYAKNKPLIGINHISGHISANYIEAPELEPPFLCLVVSGGHTHLVRVTGYGEYEVLGRTVDDAAGEAFDKVARAIGLGYPGGPKIEKAARNGDPDSIEFPRAKVADHPYDFSFSGLKSAVLNYLNHEKMAGHEIIRDNVAASFQKAVVGALTDHVSMALEEFGEKRFALAGGVASNGALRESVRQECERHGVSFYCPAPILCTDNGAMIGAAGYYEYQKGVRSGLDLNAEPSLAL